MSQAERLFDGSSLQSPLLEAGHLGTLGVCQQLQTFEHILYGLPAADEVMDMLQARDARIAENNPSVEHALALATAYKGNMTKFLIACGGTPYKGDGYKIWLNRYDGMTHAMGVDGEPKQYVERVHNHRFGLASLNIGRRGSGYTTRSWLLNDPRNHQAVVHSANEVVWARHMRDAVQVSEQSFGPGDVWSMHQDEAHSLRGILAGTVTLVIETSSQRPLSVQFNDEGTAVEKIIPGHMDRRRFALETA